MQQAKGTQFMLAFWETEDLKEKTPQLWGDVGSKVVARRGQAAISYFAAENQLGVCA